eukprot:4343596-Prymnesium_polylepis.2
MSANALVGEAREVEVVRVVAVVHGVVRTRCDLRRMRPRGHIGQEDEELQASAAAVVMPPPGRDRLHQASTPASRRILDHVPVISHVVAQIATDCDRQARVGQQWLQRWERHLDSARLRVLDGSTVLEGAPSLSLQGVGVEAPVPDADKSVRVKPSGHTPHRHICCLAAGCGACRTPPRITLPDQLVGPRQAAVRP